MKDKTLEYASASAREKQHQYMLYTVLVLLLNHWPGLIPRPKKKGLGMRLQLAMKLQVYLRMGQVLVEYLHSLGSYFL